MTSLATPDASGRPTAQENEAVENGLADVDADTPVIVDFDETLWLRNSTEEYLSSLRPRFLAFLVLTIIDTLRPWAVLPGGERRHVYRDWLRVMVATLVMPWGLLAWRRRAAALAQDWTNEPLLARLLRTPAKPIFVATFGFDMLVRPIVTAMSPRLELACAGSFLGGWRIRRTGKRACLEASLGAATVARSVVITDSENDRDLLDACAVPVLTTWPDAAYRPAFADAYVPYLYTQKGKRPGKNYMLRSVILEDVVLVSLALAWSMAAPWEGLLAILILHLSFWTIYEVGYAENDVVAIKHEANPTKWPESERYAARVKPVQAWAFALLLAVPGAWLAVDGNAGASSLLFDQGDDNAGGWTVAEFFVLWTLFLAASRLGFWVYNHVDVETRTYLYAMLQLFRVFGYTLFFPTTVAGAFLLIALVMTRWVPYMVYRQIGRRWTESHRFLLLLFFGVLSLGGLASMGTAYLDTQFLVISAWLLATSSRRWLVVVQDARLVVKN